jgi:hypothetical protein
MQMLQAEGFVDVGIQRDLSGLDRVVYARRKNILGGCYV